MMNIMTPCCPLLLWREASLLWREALEWPVCVDCTLPIPYVQGISVIDKYDRVSFLWIFWVAEWMKPL